MVQHTVCHTKQSVHVSRGPADGEQQVTTCNGEDNGKALALANFNLAIPLNMSWSH
jgi:hypothetical protein